MPATVTLNGFEIRDTGGISRFLNDEGDGLAPFTLAGVGPWEATTNLLTNGGFETNTTGWAATGSNSLARSTEQAKFGSASCKGTYGSAGAFGRFPLTLTAAEYTFSIWLYVPADYDGALVFISDNGDFVGATGTQLASADMNLRDQWQRLSFDISPVGGDLDGALHVRPSGAATVGKFIYFDGAQIELQPIATPYVETDGGTASRTAARVQADIADIFQPRSYAAEVALDDDSLVGEWILQDVNLLTNSDFEVDTTGAVAGGANTIEQSIEQAKFGANSLKVTYQDTKSPLARIATGPTVTAAEHTFSAYVYIPSSWDGGTIVFDDSGTYGSATGTQTVNADMSLTDQWQRVSFDITFDAGDLVGNFHVTASTAPTAGEAIYVDGLQLELAAATTDYHARGEDSSDNRNHGVITLGSGVQGAASLLSQAAADDTSKSMEFDGADTRVNIADATALQDIFMNGGGTIEAVFDADSDGENDRGVIVLKNGTGYNLNVQDEAGGLVSVRLKRWFSGTDGEWNTDVFVPISQTVHLAVTYDDSSTSNVPIFYVNGAAVTVNEIAAPTGTADSDVGDNIILGNSAGVSSTFDGHLQHLRMYSSVLSAERILEHANRAFCGAVQSWFAFRVVPAWDSDAEPHNYVTLLDWRSASNRRLSLQYAESTDKWLMDSVSPAGGDQIVTAAQTFLAGSSHTVIAYVEDSNVGISANGAAFLNEGNRNKHAPLISGTTADIGSLSGTSRHADTRFLWVAWGIGTLTDADAALMHTWAPGGLSFDQFSDDSRVTAIWDCFDENMRLATEAPAATVAIEPAERAVRDPNPPDYHSQAKTERTTWGRFNFIDRDSVLVDEDGNPDILDSGLAAALIEQLQTNWRPVENERQRSTPDFALPLQDILTDIGVGSMEDIDNATLAELLEGILSD